MDLSINMLSSSQQQLLIPAQAASSSFSLLAAEESIIPSLVANFHTLVLKTCKHSPLVHLSKRQLKSKFDYPTRYMAPPGLSKYQEQQSDYLTLLRAHTSARCYLIVQLLFEAKIFTEEIDPRLEWWSKVY
jgi:hypothetical protein